MKTVTLHPAPRRFLDWLRMLATTAMVVGGGILLGMQYMNPNKRVLAVAAAAVMFGIAWRLELLAGVGLLVLALPFPRATVFGSTNLALILAMLLIWLLRVGQGAAHGSRRTPLDVPIAGLFIAYVVSFYNVPSLEVAGFAMSNFLNVVACMALFYLVVSCVRRPADLARLHVFQVISIGMVCLISLFELNFPGRSLVPGWIEFGHVVSEGVDRHRMRIGGPFFDFELLADYCAISLLLLLFLTLRRGPPLFRMTCAVLIAMVAFVMFATVTRGAVVALGFGLIYFTWLLRRRISFVSIVIAVAVLVVGVAGMNFYVSNFTHSGDLLARLADPQTLRFVNGMPEGRSGTWSDAFERMMYHPIIGHGPFYEVQRGTTFWYWPHNLYLYVGNLVGFFGLFWFLLLLGTMLRVTRTKNPDWNDPNYARAYLAFAHVQLVVFMIDQLKIEYLRNTIYQFQVWLMFAGIVAAHLCAREAVPARVAVPARTAPALPSARSA